MDTTAHSTLPEDGNAGAITSSEPRNKFLKGLLGFMKRYGPYVLGQLIIVSTIEYALSHGYTVHSLRFSLAVMGASVISFMLLDCIRQWQQNIKAPYRSTFGGWKCQYIDEPGGGRSSRIEDENGEKVVEFGTVLTPSEALRFKQGFDFGIERGKIEGMRLKEAEIRKTLGL